MSPTQSAWRSIPAKDEPNLGELLPVLQMVDTSRSIATTGLSFLLTGFRGPDRGPNP